MIFKIQEEIFLKIKLINPVNSF